MHEAQWSKHSVTFIHKYSVDKLTSIVAIGIPGAVRVSAPRPGPHPDPGLCPDPR